MGSLKWMKTGILGTYWDLLGPLSRIDVFMNVLFDQPRIRYLRNIFQYQIPTLNLDQVSLSERDYSQVLNMLYCDLPLPNYAMCDTYWVFTTIYIQITSVLWGLSTNTLSSSADKKAIKCPRNFTKPFIAQVFDWDFGIAAFGQLDHCGLNFSQTHAALNSANTVFNHQRASEAQRSTAEHSGAQRSTAEHSEAQRSTAEHSGAQRSTAERSKQSLSQLATRS